MRFINGRRPSLLGWALILVLILAALLLLDRYLPGRAYKRAEGFINKEFAAIQVSKQPVFSAIKGDVCGSAYEILESKHGCSYQGEKVFKGSDTFAKDILEMDKKLTSLGWKRTQCYGPCGGFDRLLGKGGSNGQPLRLEGEVYVAYKKSGHELDLFVIDRDTSTDKRASFNNDAFAKDRGLSLQNDGEYLYAVYLSEEYSSTSTVRTTTR